MILPIHALNVEKRMPLSLGIAEEFLLKKFYQGNGIGVICDF